MQRGFSTVKVHIEVDLLANSITNYKRNNINLIETQKVRLKKVSNSFCETNISITPKADKTLQDNRIIGQYPSRKWSKYSKQNIGKSNSAIYEEK